MKAVKGIVKLLAICCVCAVMSLAKDAKAPNMSTDAAVAMEITELDANASTLTLSYKIRNASDHEVWICNEVSRARTPFEMYLTHDRQTLLVRRRLDVPTTKIWHRPPDPGTYVRVSPGAAQPESLRIDLPAAGQFMYASETTEVVAQTVRRLVLEVGYYDENLPALVRSICAVANEFSDEGWKLYTSRLNADMWQTYFRGLAARGALADFDVVNKNPESKGYAYINYSYQALTEKVLRMEINGVGIPYKGHIEALIPANSGG